MKLMNKLTKRLLKRNLKEGFDLGSISKLVDAFSETIDQYEQDRLMLERSLMLTSNELNEINDALRLRITEIQNNQDLLKHQAYHDSLTALPNRINIMNTIQHALALAKRHQQKCAILFIDLDDFKKINDTAGHSEGDRFLIEVSKRLQAILRESDTLGRLGGDEFIIILENIASSTQITKIYNRALKSLSTPFIVDGNPYVVSCSIGISNFPQDGKTAEELIRKADLAMYQAKKLGKNRFHYFDESLERLAIHRVKTEESLREAIKNNEFVLYYQPKIQINLQQEKLVGVEALIRWKKEDGSLVYPDNFIPIAEKCGLIKSLTKWVITEACKQLKLWKNTSLANIPISVNISAIDIADHRFVESTLSILETYDTPGHLINLELTESVFFDDINTVNFKLEELHRNNITISLDDFGTGYSSLSYIQELQIDFLKIDKSFIFGMSKNKKSLAIVKSIIDMGNNLGLTVIAEGVETLEDKETLIKANCHIAQGYLYSRPIEASKLEEFYRQ
jgi:diguanylate cyclase (GGDEF)-like protein